MLGLGLNLGTQTTGGGEEASGDGTSFTWGDGTAITWGDGTTVESAGS